MEYTIACPCLFGLESILSGEVKRMGGQNVEVTDGRVVFKGDAAMVVKANLMLRTAERVMIVVGSFSADSFTKLFDGSAELPWEKYIPLGSAFPVKGWSLHSKLHSIPDCQAIIKKSVAVRLSKHYQKEWLPETGATYQIRFTIHKDNVMLMLDTSGEGLHKRGYRPVSNAAPIKETLAAGMIDLARVKRDSLLIDPMCGSGTILVEGASKALRMPSGIKRTFVSETWDMFPRELWASVKEDVMSQVNTEHSFSAQGFDIDIGAVALSAQNAKTAGFSDVVTTSYRELANFTPPDRPFTVITNPPYGERMSDIQSAEELYKLMGRVFLPTEGSSYYIISPNEDFEKLFGRPANKRRKLYNGMIRCTLYMYF